MKAWQVSEWCEPEQMTLADLPVPEPTSGEVRIRNHAAALNFFDVLQIQGKYQTKPPLPFTPGAEVAGVVDAVGTGIDHLSVGDRVMGSGALGGFAEYTVTPGARTFRIPTKMDFAAAAAMLIVYQTSYLALKVRAAIKAQEWLLVHAAAGGVGSSAMQLGKAFGARVIATAGSADKVDFCLTQGADYAVNYREAGWVEQVKEITEGHGADVIYDPVGGDVFDLSTKCIAAEGRLLVIGFAGGRIPSIAANRILLKNMSVVGCYWGGYLEHHPGFLAQTQADLFALYDAGQIKPVVSQTYALEDAVTALKALAARKTFGKVVLTIG
ncbi:MAG: NADPH:quinone oxidoreductase family protein [Pyrinomonadaceae bacterium]|nr:NADPH:quinone oxidoreductase family protein [Pyrinomonadaceae bacterium]